MIRLLLSFTILICLVHSDNEALSNQLRINELQYETKQIKDNKINLQNYKRHIIEENQNFKPCKENKLETQLSEEFPATGGPVVPSTANYLPINTDSKGVVDEFPQGSDYNNRRKNINIEPENSEVLINKEETVDKNPANLITDDPIMNLRRRICGNSIVPESVPSTRRILPGMIQSPSIQEIEDYKLIHNIHPFQSNIQKQLSQRQNDHPKIETRVVENVNEDHVNELKDQQVTTQEGLVESRFNEPTKGEGVPNMKDTNVMLLEKSRICYACSTISDFTCWAPDRRTTVKYCAKGNQSCLTKTFNIKGSPVLIRDCGSTCVSQYDQKYNSCSICHSDFCNGASTLNIHTTGIAIVVLFAIYFLKL